MVAVDTAAVAAAVQAVAVAVAVAARAGSRTIIAVRHDNLANRAGRPKFAFF